MKNNDILLRLEGIYTELMKGDAGAVYSGLTALMSELKEPVTKAVSSAVDKALEKRLKALDKFIEKTEKKASSKNETERRKAKYAGCVYVPNGPEKALEDGFSVITNGEIMFVTDDDTEGHHGSIDGEVISGVLGLYNKFNSIKTGISTETYETIPVPAAAKLKEFKADWKSIPSADRPNWCLTSIKQPELFYTFMDNSAYTVDTDKLLEAYGLLGIKGGEPEAHLHIPRQSRKDPCFITIDGCERWCLVLPILAVSESKLYEI